MATQTSHEPASAERRTPPAARLLAAAAVVVALAAGVLVLGRLANSDLVAMLLTGAWFAAVLVAGYALARRRRALLAPMAAAYAASAVAAGALLGLPMITDRTVDEDVVTAEPAPAAAAPDSAASAASPASPAPPARNVQLAAGEFVPLAHAGSGNAAVIELAAGGRRLTLTDFRTDNGPDLRVYLTTKDPARGEGIGKFKDLGALKGNKGDQQYTVPADLDLSTYSTVVVWCRAFDVGFVSASLAA